MNVLIIGSGGREHAVAWKLSQSSQIENLFIAPGNAGTAEIGTNVSMSPTDFDAISKYCLENNVKIVFVGPEAPLVEGIHDYFESKEELAGITVIGPKKEGAILEGSKDFSKKFMKRHNIPTAKYGTFTSENLEAGYAFLDKMKAPYVLKADGLAGGKGVLILDDLAEAKKELKSMITESRFGEASNKVVIEEFLDGIEVSVFIITDGKSYKILPEAKDYKRIGEGDTGLNTGGMGAISPVPFAGREFMDKVDNQVIIPTVKGLRAEGIDYSGFIFFGLISVKGDPYVIEYNCRMGDPETEVVMPRLKSDLLDLFDGMATGTLSERDVEFDPRTAATVMLVAGGYPEEYKKGDEISGLTDIDNSVLFHAGTTEKNDAVVTNGGRVIAVTSYGKDIESALKNSYDSVEKLTYKNMNFRKDIGFDLIKKPQDA